MKQNLLEVKNLYTSFSTLSKKIRAVRGVSFHLEEGETLGIVGESGSGKSVMAKSLIRLLPTVTSSIDNGEIYYKGENLLLKKERELRKIRGKEIGMIFQDPMTSLNPTLKIKDQIIEGYALHYPLETKKTMKKKALSLLQQVGVSDATSRLNQYPHELSGGMRQRVMIAIAMISSPRILIADEPTTALDVTIQAQIFGLLKKIQKEEKMSIVLITHDFSIVAGFCDRVLVMYAGQVVESARVETLFKDPKHPYTRRLLNSIPYFNDTSPLNLYSIHGSPPNLSSKIQGCAFAKRCPHAMHLCHDEIPKLMEVEEDHRTACWLFDPLVAREER